jgi:hypothetical protein
MKNMSTGAGLALLGLGIAVHPLLSGLASSATASASTATAAAALASAASPQAGPTVVWMGIDGTIDNFGNGDHRLFRLWSDGRIEFRRVTESSGSTGCGESQMACDWIEVPPSPGGNGFACRTDINGDRKVDGADLSFVLNAWGQEGGCEPEATYPCLDLGNLAGGVALK